LRAEAARALIASGVQPVRRLATLRPRVGESLTRTADIAYFVQRFGHEYTVVVAGPPDGADCRELLVAACADAGCTLLFADATDERQDSESHRDRRNCHDPRP
jgi:hypothetical protein